MLCSFVLRKFLPIIFFVTGSLLPLYALDPGSLFDTRIVVRDIEINGNYKTKRRIILAELPFSMGEQINMGDLISLIARGKENLLNSSLFNRVEIDFYYPDRSSVVISLDVKERWYIWAFPVFEQEGRNFSDFLRLNDGTYFNYGVYLKHDNFRGRREMIKLRAVTGYKKQMVFSYQKPGLNQKTGWGVNLSWLWNDQMPYATFDDKQVFLKTIGSRLLTRANVDLSYSYRHNLDHYHSVNLGYENIDASDTLIALNPNMLPDGKGLSETLSLAYNYRYDLRDSKVYPLRGTYLEAEVARIGFGVESKYEGFFRGRVVASYHDILLENLFYSVKGFASVIDSDDVPYIFKTGLGYGESLNGFEFRVIDGSSYGVAQTKFLYELIPRKDIHLKWMPLEQFSQFHYAIYLKAHFDAGYVVNENRAEGNNMANELLLGYGLGVDMVTFYDKVLSLNYSFNNFAEHGFYFHFNLAL